MPPTYDLTTAMGLVVGAQQYSCCPPDNDGKAVTLAEMVEHLNTQTDTGPVERWYAERGALAYDVRRGGSNGRLVLS